MSRAAAQGLGRFVQLANPQGLQTTSLLPAVGIAQQHIRHHGGGVPEFWGRDSPYHPGTNFLGTPPDHLERVKERPVSPHVFEPSGTQFHYKMPINAVTSILNRVTGTALTVGFTAAGGIALMGDLPATVETIKSMGPAVVYPLRAIVAFPVVYHYLGGVRHVFWDKAKYGNQADKNSPLENEAVNRSSQLLVGASLVGTAALAAVSF